MTAGTATGLRVWAVLPDESVLRSPFREGTPWACATFAAQCRDERFHLYGDPRCTAGVYCFERPEDLVNQGQLIKVLPASGQWRPTEPRDITGVVGEVELSGRVRREHDVAYSVTSRATVEITHSMPVVKGDVARITRLWVPADWCENRDAERLARALAKRYGVDVVVAPPNDRLAGELARQRTWLAEALGKRKTP